MADLGLGTRVDKCIRSICAIGLWAKPEHVDHLEWVAERKVEGELERTALSVSLLNIALMHALWTAGRSGVATAI